MSELIAAVAIAVMVDGKREVVQPGQALPELSEHDTHELLRSGAVVDSSLALTKKQDAEKAAAAAMADFDEARQRVIAERESTKPPASPKKGNPGKTK